MTRDAPGVRTGERFGRAERLLKRRDFRRIQRSGRRRVGRFVVAVARRGERPWTRIGLTVSKKVGNAVTRNRIKRRLRAIFRRNKTRFPQGWDIVLIARRQAASASFEALRDEVIELCSQLPKA